MSRRTRKVKKTRRSRSNRRVSRRRTRKSRKVRKVRKVGGAAGHMTPEQATLHLIDAMQYIRVAGPYANATPAIIGGFLHYGADMNANVALEGHAYQSAFQMATETNSFGLYTYSSAKLAQEFHDSIAARQNEAAGAGQSY